MSRSDLPERDRVVLEALTDACPAEEGEGVSARPVAERADVAVHSAIGSLLKLRERHYVSSRQRGRAGPTHWAPTAQGRTSLGR